MTRNSRTTPCRGALASFIARSSSFIRRLLHLHRKQEFDNHSERAISGEKARFNDDSNPLDVASMHSETEMASSYSDFIASYPEYLKTWTIDSLRQSEFSRLDNAGETYVDYMGGCLYPGSLVRAHAEFLNRNIFGNTHSVSNSSRLSSECAQEARHAVLKFFDAPAGYTVIFTANATAALKLVGESYPFFPGSSFALGADSHNSVNGIRRFAVQGGAKVCYLKSSLQGGFVPADAERVLHDNRPDGRSGSLFVMTALSNITNSKNPLSTIAYAKSLGYDTVLDAAAYAPSTALSLRKTPVDAMVVSFYKMFGYPTGVGALIVKESFLTRLRRPWFSGGTVDVVQVPGEIVTMSLDVREQFEDGTTNYLSLPAISRGLQFLSIYLPLIPMRLSCLTHYLISKLRELTHDTNAAPLVQILSRIPRKRVLHVGEEFETGSTVSLLFLGDDGKMLPNTFVEYAATLQKISLRTGCVCNPGGAATLLDQESEMSQLVEGVTLKDFERAVGRELGVVRISLGIISSFSDVHKVVEFSAMFGKSSWRRRSLLQWERTRKQPNSAQKFG